MAVPTSGVLVDRNRRNLGPPRRGGQMAVVPLLTPDAPFGVGYYPFGFDR